MSRTRIIAATIAVGATALLGLTACSNGTSTAGAENTTSAAATVTPSATPTVATPADLTGAWSEPKPADTDMWQEATITGDTIEINWVQADGTKALYWSGSYTPPAGSEHSSTWISAGNKEKMDAALLASTDDSKTFTFADGTLSYPVTAMGVTVTEKLTRTTK